MTAQTPDPIAARIEELFGRRQLPKDAGVVHVTALSRRDGGYRTILIDEHSPKSPNDFFCLQLGRARADVIVLSGKLLRDEAALDYTLRGPDARALRNWRRREQGRTREPTLALLTRSGELPAQHPIFSGPNEVLVFTSPHGAHEAQARLPQLRVESSQDPSLSDLLTLLRVEGATTIVLEAGPGTTAPAYRADLIDELMLSTFEGPFSSTLSEGPAPFDRRQLELRLPHASHAVQLTDASGSWSFERRTRRVLL
jgi:riboflavin biosynthesis pyrimidine reductase